MWPYLVALSLATLAWVTFVLFGSYEYWQHTGNGVSEMGSTLRNGLFVVVGVLVVAFAGHWVLRSSRDGVNVASAATPSKISTAAPTVNPSVTGILASDGARYVLEVRGLGMAVSGRHQDTLWKQISAKSDNFVSVLSHDAKDYPDSPDRRALFAKVDTGAAFEYAAAEAVERWPLPVIVIGPPKDENSKYRAALDIAYARQQAGLGVTLFLWQDDANTDNAGASLERLFQFFDTHPDVPAALVFSDDGMETRFGYKTPGAGAEPTGPYVPPIPNSNVGLLVSRSDRVDRLIRPYAVPGVPGKINQDDTSLDIIKLWNFYWQHDTSFQDETDAAAGGFNGAMTMKADWWISKLPELWKQITNKGPGDFKPSPYLPVRWTDWQVKEFDDSPLLGYLHRPVNIRLTDEHGKPLKRADQVKALQAGWQQAIATLPDGEKPARVFYDTTSDREWVIPLTQALHGNAQGIELDNVKEGYDIGRRVGNTGVSSALVQIGLATVAGYENGGASATINLASNGTAGIVMVSPPNATSKAANVQHRGENPFRFRVPG
ncbi:DUF2875 family protein [Paraburkholderia xenovorans]|uniref:type VI lipase adapter Tla3 domain-containing protein n=1 Tax=Paraburkholderia xenovorans TaxID=36873 RepID=UPI0038B96B81